jgi:hypothetical protein
MTTIPAPLCLFCKRMFDPDGTPIPKCRAFPEKVPDLIWLSKVDHREEVEGDRGWRFVPKDENAAEYASLIFDE